MSQTSWLRLKPLYLMHIRKTWYNVFSGVSNFLDVSASAGAEMPVCIDNFPLVKEELRNISMALNTDTSNQDVDLSRIHVSGYLHQTPLLTTNTDVMPLDLAWCFAIRADCSCACAFRPAPNLTAIGTEWAIRTSRFDHRYPSCSPD
jgi:hypothetical protein